ncbi:MAG: hypothetical protein NTZ33_15660 [Bacteroidetes bacterium]|nr:hypothetical protein [Bacteroidota bacterium]
MNEIKTINFIKEDGPITIEIISGYATLGSYNIAYNLNDNIVPVGNGKLADNIPDIFILPVSIDNLSDCNVLIVGNYMSAPSHDQISVDYVFLQKGIKLIGDNPVEIREQGSVLRTNHMINFNKI